MCFDDKTIERLQKIAWDWDIEKINRNLKLVCNLDVDRLESAGE
jgi:virginiamycin A acetyltransferase